MPARYYLGIDGGGTKTRALLTDSQGSILGSGVSGSTNRNHHTGEQVRANLRDAMLAASAGSPINNTAVFLGMCGVSTNADRADIVSIARDIPELSPSVKVIVENDARIGLTGGLSGRAGIVLIAGTGSACLGVNARGETWWCGGWGAMADDAGSAAWIGLRAMQMAVRAEDGRVAPTALRDIVFNFLSLRKPRELIDRVHNRGLTREELGALAPRVIAAAGEGDAVASRIVADAVVELSQLVCTTASRLFSKQPCEMILVGGLALSGPPFQPMLIERIQRDTPTIAVRDPEMSPVQGAVLEAMRADGVFWTPSLLNKLRKANT